MFGSQKIAGVVTSDHSGNNMPAGILVLQDLGRLNMRRSIAVNIGADAAKYVPGDSVIITVAGGTLERKNGMLQSKYLARDSNRDRNRVIPSMVSIMQVVCSKSAFR